MMLSPFCFPVNGTVRTKDARVILLYKKAQKNINEPCLWEGLFRLACLVKTKPAEEKVTEYIYNSIAETESGEFPGTITDQICIARAAMALFEYNTDKKILKRVALWLRYFEIEFDRISLQNNLLFQPADLMELLIRYYNITGMKSVLRICAKLRAEAFDWTTALHTFQQSIPLRNINNSRQIDNYECKPEEVDYEQKELLINHAEMIADGVRFTLYSGLYSGHSQDLSSGRTVWEHLSKHHRAICGGTTGNPFLHGSSPEQAVSNIVISAWTEAFASQLYLDNSEWAVDELIRIVFNGLNDCLNQDDISEAQRVNTIQNHSGRCSDTVRLYARITRAVAAVYNHAVAISEKGIRINYILPGKYMFTSEKQRIILNCDGKKAVFQCKEPFSAQIDFFVSHTGTSNVILIRGKQRLMNERRTDISSTGFYIRAEGQWNNEDGFIQENNGSIVSEDTHHQGICFYSENKLMTVKADREHYAFAVCGHPEKKDGRITILLSETGKWPVREDEPSDIPVLPADTHTTFTEEMIPYSDNSKRIAMFPKAGGLCLK